MVTILRAFDFANTFSIKHAILENHTFILFRTFDFTSSTHPTSQHNTTPHIMYRLLVAAGAYVSAIYAHKHSSKGGKPSRSVRVGTASP